MSNKPAIVLSTGSFSLPEFYEEVTGILRKQGYEVSDPQLVTVGKKPGPPPSVQDDAALLAREIEKFADQGKDVLVVAHSYGGIPASESTKGLTKQEREKEGKKGGVVRLAYLTCLVPDVGGNAAQTLEGAVEENYIEPDSDGWLFQKDPSVTAKYVFNDLPPEEGTAWIKRFPQHSAVSFGAELTHAGYKDVPSSWLFCEGDLCIPPSYQQAGIDRIEKASGKKVDVTKKPWDHVPIVLHAAELADWIVAAGEKGDKWD